MYLGTSVRHLTVARARAERIYRGNARLPTSNKPDSRTCVLAAEHPNKLVISFLPLRFL